MKKLWRITVIAFFIAGALWVVWPAIHGRHHGDRVFIAGALWVVWPAIHASCHTIRIATVPPLHHPEFAPHTPALDGRAPRAQFTRARSNSSAERHDLRRLTSIGIAIAIRSVPQS